MTFRIDDDQLDPDLFLKRAIEAKLEHINRRIEELMTNDKSPAMLEAYLDARARFVELQRSPRLYLSKPAESAAPAGAIPAPAKPARASLPLGAIPQPKKYAGAGGAAPAAPVAPPAAPPGQKGMLGFLKSVQAGGTATTPVAPAPAAPAATAASAVTTAPAQAATPAATAPAPVAPSVAPTKGGGPMLSFLKKMQQGLAAPADQPPTVPPPAPLPPENRQAIIDSLKEEAASRGFADIYAMLRFKREKLMESRRALAQNPDANAARIIAVLEHEIAEVDQLLKEDPRAIARKLNEFKEVAAVDKGGLAALDGELSGLLEELK